MRPTEEELKLALKKAREICDEIHAAERRMATVLGISEEKLLTAVPEGIEVLSESDFLLRRFAEGVFVTRATTPRRVVDVDELEKFWPAVDAILLDLSSGLCSLRVIHPGAKVAACAVPRMAIQRKDYLLQLFAYAECLLVANKEPSEAPA